MKSFLIFPLTCTYAHNSISNLSKDRYLAFFKSFLKLAFDHAKPTTRLAFLNADWRNFQSVSALDEDERSSILITNYAQIMSDAGWKITQYIDCPMSSQRFHPGLVLSVRCRKKGRWVLSDGRWLLPESGKFCMYGIMLYTHIIHYFIKKFFLFFIDIFNSKQ